jgi:hypothetical protein
MPVNISNIHTSSRLDSNEDRQFGPENTQELVKKVADLVYEMLLQEMRIEYERGRSTYGIRYLFKGGR